VIGEKAQELGKLIGQGEEFKALHRARAALAEDKDLQQQLERLEGLASQLERTIAEGTQPDSAETEQYEQLLGDVQANPAYQGLVASQSNFDKLMLRVQEQIMEGMQKGAESRIITLG
jgi:cell fate (sporulation/competence/biofilm development) regulator YlbF (YheA/YmcA/DUF963 family)